jgi:hypothetical protein
MREGKQSRRGSGAMVGDRLRPARAALAHGASPLLGLLALLLCVPLVTSAKGTQWQTYISDDFSGQSAFFQGQSGEALYSIDHGRYIIDGKHATQDSLSALTDNLYYYYVEAQCQVLETSAGELAFSGIVFHYTKQLENSRAYYVFYIYGDGYYGAKRVIGDDVQIVIPLSRCSDIDPSHPNVLAVDAQGTRFDLYINGKYVNGFTDVRIDGGGFGFYVSKQTVGAFDNFKVKIERRDGGNQGQVFPPSTEDNGNGGGDNGDNGGGKYPKLDIPKDPNRPTYPWEVGVHHGKRQHGDKGTSDDTDKGADKNAGKDKGDKHSKQGGQQGDDAHPDDGSQGAGGSDQSGPAAPPDQPSGSKTTSEASPDPSRLGTVHPAYDGPLGPGDAPGGAPADNQQLMASAQPPAAYTPPAASAKPPPQTTRKLPAGEQLVDTPPAGRAASAPQPPANPDESTVLLVPADTLRPAQAKSAPPAQHAPPPDSAPAPSPAPAPDRGASSADLSLTRLGEAADSAIVPMPPSAPSRAAGASGEAVPAAAPPPEKTPKPGKLKIVNESAPKADKPKADKPKADTKADKPRKEKPPKPPKADKSAKAAQPDEPVPPPAAPAPAPAAQPAAGGNGADSAGDSPDEHERLAMQMRQRGFDDTGAPPPVSRPVESAKPAAQPAPAPSAAPAAQDDQTTGEGVQLPPMDSAQPAAAPPPARPGSSPPAKAPAPAEDEPAIVALRKPPASNLAWEDASQAPDGQDSAAPQTPDAGPDAAAPRAPDSSTPPSTLDMSPQPSPPAAAQHDDAPGSAIPLPRPALNPELGELAPPQHGPAAGPSSDADPFAGKPGLTHLTDDFSTQRWPVSSANGSNYRYFGGKYELDNLQAQSMAISYQGEKLGDVRFDAAVDYLDGASYVGYGCAVRFSMENGQVSYYGMFVSQAGECLLLKVQDGQESVLADWKACSGYLPGQTNQLRLEAIGGYVRGYVNGTLAQQAQDNSLPPGGYALLAGPGVKVRFDNLELTGLHPSGN